MTPHQALPFPDAAAWSLNVYELRERLQRPEPVLLLDIREPDEFGLCHIEGAHSLPFLELPDHLHELNPQADIVVYCHTGNRSLDAVRFLARRGFARVRHLEGGIDLWALAVDRRFPIYGRDMEKTSALKRAFSEKVAKMDGGLTV